MDRIRSPLSVLFVKAEQAELSQCLFICHVLQPPDLFGVPPAELLQYIDCFSSVGRPTTGHSTPDVASQMLNRLCTQSEVEHNTCLGIFISLELIEHVVDIEWVSLTGIPFICCVPRSVA